MTEVVKEHDIWTSKITGDDYAVQSVGNHAYTGEGMVAVVDCNGMTVFYPLESFVVSHELTARVYKDI